MDVEKKLSVFIRREFGQGKPVGPDAPLLDSGLVDSVGILRLVAFLEGEFRVRVKDGDLVPANFQTMRSIARFLATRRPARPKRGSGR
jgi:acyl carrier protein